VPRDTLNNIEDTGHFTINHVHSDMVHAAHQCSARYPADVSEFAATGLNERWSAFPAPFVAESHLSIGLRLAERVDIRANGTHLLIGEVSEVWLPEGAVQDDGYIDVAVLDSVAVTGLDTYHRLLTLERLPYAKP